MIQGQKVRELREAKGWSQYELAAAIGVKQASVDKIERGITRQSRYTPRIARTFGVPLSTIDPDWGNDENFRPPQPLFDPVHKMPVFASAEGGDGALILDGDPIEWVVRPYVLEHVADAFAVVVTGESMVPAYKPHDRAWVNPRLRPLGGQDCILYQRHPRTGEARGLIKEFVREAGEQWVVQQHNPPKELRFPKSEWPMIYKVVGKFNR